MRIATDVTNTANGKRYILSTVEVEIAGARRYQTVVFRQRFGPLAGFFRPVLCVGGARENMAHLQHECVEAIVRDRNPKDWEAARWELAANLTEIEVQNEAAEDQRFYEEMLKMSGADRDNASK